MKNYDKDRPDPRPDSAPQNKLSAKPGEAAGVEGTLHRSISATKTETGHSEPPDLLKQQHLSHPANAGQLAGMLSELQQSHGNAYVQQVVSGMKEPKPVVEAQATGGGQTLEGGVKSEMESAFGESFDGVRIHTGSEAEKMNEELGARAVTRGRDIYFNAGEYNPATQEGRELLAHELTHVVQQKGEASSNARSSVGQAGDSFELEADRAASAILGGERAVVSQRGATPSHQRQGARQSRPQPQPQQPDAGADAGVADYPRVINLSAADSIGNLGPHARYQYRHNPGGVNYNLLVLFSRPLNFVSMTSTIDATFAPHGLPNGVLELNVTGTTGRQVFLQLQFNLGRRDIFIRFNFPIRPART